MVAERVPRRTGDPRRSAVLPNGGTFGRRVARGPERPGQAADVRWKRRRILRDCRCSLRIHMSFVSSVSQTLMDKCEAEGIPISLAAVKAQGEASLKCGIHTYYSLASIAKGSVRTLFRSVEEYDGAEAYCLIRSTSAPDTQDRQRMCFDAEDDDASEALVRTRSRFRVKA